MAVADIDVSRRMCEALGLKNVVRLDLHLSVWGAPILEAEFYPEADGIHALETIVQAYKLVPKDDSPQQEAVTGK